MKKFNVDLLDFPKLNRIDGDIRLYELPTGEKYPSVTTVLGAMSDKSALDDWRNRIGHEEAEKITKRSSSRGSNVHDLCERYVTNQEIDLKKEMPFDVSMFKQLKLILDANVDNVICSESQLYSHKLKIAGSVDLVADWNGVTSVIDFKTSIKNKKKEWITDYFNQVTLYAYMLWEMTGILCRQIVILIAIEEENFAQIFIEDISQWFARAELICKEYHKKFLT